MSCGVCSARFAFRQRIAISGRMGKGGIVHLVSPATAAYTAIRGVITEPPVNLCNLIVNREANAPMIYGVVPTDWKEQKAERPDYGQLLANVDKNSSKDFSGKVFYLPADNVDTDQIIPAKYLTETRKEEFGKHCLEDAPISAEDRTKLYQSQILVAGENFGCGSSREHAPWALEAAGIRCVIAPSFARIFENNMFANGLLCITLPKGTVDLLMKNKPETLSVDLEEGVISWSEKIWPALGESEVVNIGFTLSDYRKDLTKNGGAVGVMLKLAAELQKRKIDLSVRALRAERLNLTNSKGGKEDEKDNRPRNGRRIRTGDDGGRMRDCY